MKKSIAIGFISALLLGGCGRPENYKEQAKIDFSGAYTSLLADYNQGVVIAAVQANDTSKKKFFWLRPNERSGEAQANMQTGLWKFYAIGFSGPSIDGASFKCGYQPPINLNPGYNEVSMTLGTCGGENNPLPDSDKRTRATMCKTTFNNNFHCGGTY